MENNRGGGPLNCFGILTGQNEFHSGGVLLQTTTKSINTKFLIAFFDIFVIDLKKISVVVIDNAKIHHSKAFKKRIEYWEKRVGTPMRAIFCVLTALFPSFKSGGEPHY